jgi:DNA-binding XRE family transcriptional regulator
MLNKKAVIVISSLGLIALSQLLIAFAAHRARHKTLQINTLSSQTSSKEKNIFTTSIKKQEEESRPQSESFRRGSDTAETTMAAAAAATTISTNITNADNEITVPTLTLAGIVPSPVVPFSTTESAIKGSPSRTPKEQEISISDEARKAGESLKELIVAAIKDAKDSAKGTGKLLKEETIGIAATTDSKDIKSSGDDVNTLVGLFEKTMVEIRKEHYNEQIKLLQSYKDLIQTQIKVVSARGKMASKLKPGA